MRWVEMHGVAPTEGQTQRKCERKREFTAGFFAGDDLSEPLVCLIRDMSEDGAQVRVSAVEPVPELGYIINLKTRFVQEARTVWRRGSLTGLSLGKKYRINESLPDHMGFIKDFFIEAKLRQIDQMILEGVGTAVALRKCGVTEEFYRRAHGAFLN